MAATFRSRLIQVNQLAYEQVDIFQSDFFTRITGLTPADVTLNLFLDNVVVAWPLVSGVGVPDSQVTSGSVYWTELADGSYGIRFFPNSLGFWSLRVTYASSSPQQIVGVYFDVVNLPLAVEAGLRAGFCV